MTSPRPARLAILVAALTVAVGVLAWWQLASSHQLMRQQVLLQAEQRGLQLAEAMGGQVEGLLGTIDLSLQQLRREWNGDLERFDALVRTVLGTLPAGAVTHVSVADADGLILYNSLEIPGVTRVDDRDHFRAQRDSGTDRVMIGKPVVARLGGAWTFVVNRPLLRDGDFAGTINLLVSSDYVARRLADLHLSDDDVVVLLDTGGNFMARSRALEEAMGLRVPATRPMLAPGVGYEGVFRATGMLDDVARIYAWHRLADFGLVTVVGLAEEAVLAPLASGIRFDYLLSAGLVSLLAVFSLVVVVLLLQAERHQRSIVASEAFRRRVFESSRVPTVVMDGTTLHFIDCNPAATGIYRHGTREDTLGKTPLDVSAPVQYGNLPAPEYLDMYIDRAVSDGSVNFEWRHQRPDGETWDADVHLMSFQADGRPLLQFTLQDITERKRAEAEAQRSGALLDAVNRGQSQFIAGRPASEIFRDLLGAALELTGSEHGFVGELRCGEEGRPYVKIRGVSNVNWDAEALQRFGRDDPVGMEIHELDNLFGRALTEGRVVVANQVSPEGAATPPPGGHPVIRSFMGVPFFEQGEVRGLLALANRPEGFEEGIARSLEPLLTACMNIVGSLRIEERRAAAEAGLQRLNAELERRVEQRTAEMKAAKDEAERANAAKSEFLSRMSHELRTPLNAILGFAQLLESDEQPLGAPQAANVSEIKRAGEQLLEMVNEVLDLARVESGRMDLKLESVPLAPVLDGCVAQVRALALRRRLQIRVDDPGASGARADPLRLRQVLLNLLSNAVKYNREGGSVAVHCRSVAGGRVRLAVSDTGRGIPPEFRSRLFQPFERLDSAYAGVEGTGIGLALAKRLVEAMDGVIGVDSVPGEGSTFWFELPAATVATTAMTAAGEEGARKVPVDVARVPAGKVARRYRVLYIEDSPANLLLVEKILSLRPYIKLLTAASGEAGLQAALETAPDLVLLDINMPGMDGFTVLRRLRGDPATAGLKVVAVTANAMPRDIERGQAAGFDDYLTKPFDVGRFYQVIDRNLGFEHEATA